MNPYEQKQIDCLVEDWSNSIAKVLQLLQSCPKPLKSCFQTK